MAIGPIDYSVDVKDPFQSLVQGMQLAGQISSGIEAQKEADRKRLAQAAMQEDFNALSAKPSAENIVKFSLKYPEMSENLKRGMDMLNETQRTESISSATDIYAALSAGKPDIATQLIEEKIAEHKNAGNVGAQRSAELMLKLVEQSPETAQTQAGMMLANAMGQDKFAEAFTKLAAERRAESLDPSALTEAQAKAQKAAVDAKFAESTAALDLQKKGWDITKLQEDIQINRQNSKIAAVNANLAREGNELKKQELQMKLEEAQRARDDKLNAKVADVEAARSNIDNMLSTADKIISTPMGVVGSAAGPVSARVPTLAQSTADFEELVSTLGSQSFLAQIPNIKGMGALSNAEGEKLQSALQNFSLRQSPERLIANVQEAQRLLTKARGTLAKRYGVPETIPDIQSGAEPAAQPTALPAGWGVVERE